MCHINLIAKRFMKKIKNIRIEESREVMITNLVIYNLGMVLNWNEYIFCKRKIQY